MKTVTDVNTVNQLLTYSKQAEAGIHQKAIQMLLGEGKHTYLLQESGKTINVDAKIKQLNDINWIEIGYKEGDTFSVYGKEYAMQCSVVSMELHLDASIDKLDNLAMNVQLDKEKHMENAKAQEQTEPERAEVEREEAEVVYHPWSLGRRSISIMQMHLRLEVWMR